MSLEEERSRLTAEDAELPWLWSESLKWLLIFKGFSPDVKWTQELKATLRARCGSSGRLAYDTRTEIGEEDSSTSVLHAHELCALEMHPDLCEYFHSCGIDMDAMWETFRRWNEQSGLLKLLEGLDGEQCLAAFTILTRWDVKHGDPVNQEGFRARGAALEERLMEWEKARASGRLQSEHSENFSPVFRSVEEDPAF